MVDNGFIFLGVIILSVVAMFVKEKGLKWFLIICAMGLVGLFFINQQIKTKEKEIEIYRQQQERLLK